MVKTNAPKSMSELEIDKIEAQSKKYEEGIKNLVELRNDRKVEETEPQTKLSQQELRSSPDIYLKPKRTIRDVSKFNENYRKEYEFQKEYVNFIFEHNEIIGEDITLWTKPFAGVPAEMWEVPSNKPVWGPRYLAEQIARKSYNRIIMQQDTITAQDGVGQYYGALAVDKKIQRLSALPVTKLRSVFMGASSFK